MHKVDNEKQTSTIVVVLEDWQRTIWPWPWLWSSRLGLGLDLEHCGSKCIEILRLWLCTVRTDTHCVYFTL